jgi:hypothetical protein
MRLDRLREEETRRRKGSALKTIIQFVWLAISFTAAYFLIKYFYDQDYLSAGLFYNRIGLPRWIPEEVFFAFLMLIVVTIMQFLLIAGFMFGSPLGRTRSGTPTAISRKPDPFDKSDG